MLYVVDAVVAAKWFVPEDDSSTARQLLVRHIQGIDQLIAPDFIVTEVANVLWKRLQRGDISAEQVFNSLNFLLNLRIALTPSIELVQSALRLSVNHRIAVYDALYLALSIDNACGLVTADRRFYNAVNAGFSQVKLLRDL